MPPILMALGRLAAAALARSAVGGAAARAGMGATNAGQAFNSAWRLGQTIQQAQQRHQNATPGSATQQRLAARIQTLQGRQAGELEKMGASALDAAGYIGKMAKAAMEFPKKIEAAGAALVAQQSHLGYLSGSHAIANASLAVGRLRREIDFAHATSNSYRQLVDSQNKVEAINSRDDQFWAIMNNKWQAFKGNAYADSRNFVDRNPVTSKMIAVGTGSPAVMAALDAYTLFTKIQESVIKAEKDKAGNQAQPTVEIVNFLSTNKIGRRRPPSKTDAQRRPQRGGGM